MQSLVKRTPVEYKEFSITTDGTSRTSSAFHSLSEETKKKIIEYMNEFGINRSFMKAILLIDDEKRDEELLKKLYKLSANY